MNALITQNLSTLALVVQNKSASGRGSSKKIDLYGIKKLRELILELAVRGKLVPQCPEDEPASVLLERIETERQKMIIEKKISKPKPLPAISDSEEPFALADGWKWVRLGEILHISSGNGLTAKEMNSEGAIPVYGGNGITGYHDQANVNERTLVIGRVGFYCGSIHITPQEAWVTDNAFITTFPENCIFLNYLAWLLKATNLNENDSATAQPVISGRKIYPIVVALPPKSEQHRIVAKVDELMALCDQIEQQTEASLSAHTTLVENLLATLTTSANAEELKQNWQRIASHFTTLFTTGASIDQLKQTILQLAVMGKLVPQDPNDEPAAKLLERIAAEKAQLVKEGKIKKQKPLPPIVEDEKPFKLPNGWSFVRLGDLTSKMGSGSTPRGGKSAYVDNGIPFLRSQNVWNDGLDLSDIAYITVETHVKMENTRVIPGDVLLNITGASLGRTVVFPPDLKAVS
ncbi:restriction endonuclease subunit S [Endozoicomonas sp. SCSIO W0465]|uniref:restriction endonuclease subunit S n=1 Tax=Endozoicomonas sp. SCSIO W0465 TaxID=2918516 RepID=UPI00207546C2|nr:restriction endonuclease subunit S [Endozoicomonas sp. SCSIO W0465]USE35524.1 restriction endonuclease subunit S [Endozoicomonas sp. SCSIO W0465]